MRVSLLLGLGAVVSLGVLQPGLRALDHPRGSRLAPGPAAGQVSPASRQRALLNQYCVTCHNQRLKTGGLALDTLDVSDVSARPEVWEKVVRKLRGGVMPPVGLPRPDAPSYDGLIGWLEDGLDRAAAARPNPGRTETFHRLNRAEYGHAVRDLLALDTDVTGLLPADDGSYGFDNMAGVLKLDQSRMERYLAAAETISRAAVGSPLPAPASVTYAVPPEMPQYDHVDGLPFGTRGGALFHHVFPQDGEYVVIVKLLCVTASDMDCDAAGGFAEPHTLEIGLDGTRVGQFVLEPRPMRKGYQREWDEALQIRVPVTAGPKDLAVTFLKTVPSVEYVQPAYHARFEKPFRQYAEVERIWMPAIDKVTVRGPFDARGPGETPSRRRIFVCRPATPAEEAPCARKIVSGLARRAYRQPPTREALDELLAFYEEGRGDGDGFEAGIETALRRLLLSPEFLFRIERDPAGVRPDTNYRISDLELASRLSFFLWSSIPDDELLEAAIRGTLKDPLVLERQVRRMLVDPRSRRLVDNFVGQWLELRNIEAVTPSDFFYPDFDENLRFALRRETELFFDSILREDRGAVELLTADYTFLNERLARHYRIPNVNGANFRRVALAEGTHRRGLLGHGSILTVTSHAARTSPVLRGKWLMTNVLGTPPPDPPANVPPLPENEAGKRQVRSMRERMAQHRANPVCASCHSMIDPLGFALENFDPVGRWRDVDETFKPIDAAGTFPDGTKFDGLRAFREALLSHPERFVTNLIDKLLTYSLGRGLDYHDAPAVRRIRHVAARDQYRFSSLILAIVTSSPFQMRRSAS